MVKKLSKGSNMEQWLNDTSVDGFLGNLREPDKFIKTDSVWNATSTTERTKPAKNYYGNRCCRLIKCCMNIR